MTRPRAVDWGGYGLLLLLALLWGGAYPLTKMAVETVPPVLVAATRAAIGAFVLLLILGSRVRELRQPGLPWHAFALQGMLNLVIPWLLVTWASRTIPSTITTILNSLSPIFIFLITWGITRHESASPRKFLGVTLGLVGILVIVGLDVLKGVGEHTVAELACVLGSISYAWAGVIGRRFDKVSPIVTAAGATLCATLVLMPLAFLFASPWTVAPSMRSALALLALGLLSTGAAFVIYFGLLRRLGSIGTASQAYIRIFLGVALGVGFLGEPVTLNLVLGMALVIAGVVAMTLPARR